MPEDFFTRLRKNPIRTLGLALRYMLIDHIRYSRGDGYDSQRYWNDRFQKYGFSLLAVGHEGLSEEENRANYESARRVFLTFCAEHEIAFDSARVLEIGCGTGFYTQTLHELGVKEYTGVDVTDALFPRLKASYPGYRFIRRDVTNDRIQGSYGLIVMMDVVQHIVSESKLLLAMENLNGCLDKNGVFIIAPVGEVNRSSGKFFIRSWSRDKIAGSFKDCTVLEPVSYGNETWLMGIKKTGM